MPDETSLLLQHNPGNVRFKVERCWQCGRWWAWETFGHGGSACPVCSQRQIQSLEATIAENVKSMAALRGVARRKKGGKS